MRVGSKHTEEAKKKISLSLKGNTRHLGKNHTEEAKQKISMSHTKMMRYEDEQGIKYKLCSVCRRYYLLSSFYKNKSMPDGHAYSCGNCSKFVSSKYYRDNIDTQRLYRRQYWKENADRLKKVSHDYYHKYKETKLKNTIAHNCKQLTERRRENPKDNLNHRMSTAISLSLKNNGGSKKERRWETLVGYTCNDLKNHLEKQFTEGMTWRNFISGEIHVDHIIPKRVFNFEKPEDIDFRKCWSLKNLRPLWAEDNLSKQGRLDKHFQPSFIFKKEN